MHYIFSGINQPIPKTNIIIFDGELPQSYTSTMGSVGEKIITENSDDSSLKIIDRIVKVKKGEEKIITKPPEPHEAHLYKEIQVHERTDWIQRKITIKNQSDKDIRGMELTFIEKKEVRFVESKPEPNKSDPPEYSWLVDVLPDGSTFIEITLESQIITVYKIEKPMKAPALPSLNEKMLISNRQQQEFIQ